MESLDQHAESYLLKQKYISVWELEKTVDERSWINWFKEHPMLPIYICSFYVFAIFTGQSLMRNRKAFVLKDALVVWNFLLAAFSIIGTIRTAPELVQYLKQENGFYLSVCTREHDNQASCFWLLLIVLSKAVELGDTVFIVLRKKPLIIIHWAHHVTALLYTWSTYSSGNTTARWFMTMNFFVHAIMYPYFGFRALGVRVPKLFAITITFFQILQMFIGAVVCFYSLQYKSSGVACSVNSKHAYTGLAGYGIFFLLFANFFVNAYINTNKKKSV